MDAVVHQTVERCGSTRRRPPDRRWPGACRGISIKHARRWRAAGERSIVTRGGRWRAGDRHRQPATTTCSPLRQTHARTAAVQQPQLHAQPWCGNQAPAPPGHRPILRGGPPTPFAAAAAPTSHPGAASTSPHAAPTSPHAAPTSPHAAPTSSRVASASSRVASTPSQPAPVHVGAPAGAKAASMSRDHVTSPTASFAAAAAPTSHPGPCRHRPTPHRHRPTPRRHRPGPRRHRPHPRRFM